MKNNFKKSFLLLIFIGIIFFHFECTNKAISTPVSVCDPTISFSKSIKPILDANCNMIGCHDDQVITALNSFQIVHDGAAQIKLSIQTGKMPKNRILSSSEKNAIYCWIDNGAKNN